MHLVNDVDFVFERGRRQRYGFPQLPDIIHAGIGSGVNFNNIQGLAAVDQLAGLAFFAADGVFQFLTVDRFGKNSGHGCLAGAARAGEKVSLADAVIFYGIGKRLDNVFLSDNFGEVFRTVFPV